MANDSNLRRFTVMALKRPVELQIEKVASAINSGQFMKTYNNHDGLYNDRATVFADLPGGMLYFRISNYTSKMDSVYCLFYEMLGPDNVKTCHSQALLLRNVGEYARVGCCM